MFAAWNDSSKNQQRSEMDKKKGTDMLTLEKKIIEATSKRIGEEKRRETELKEKADAEQKAAQIKSRLSVEKTSGRMPNWRSDKPKLQN